MENIWKIIVFGVIICGLVLAGTGGAILPGFKPIVPIDTKITLASEEAKTLSDLNINSASVGETVCETKECAIGELAECTTKIVLSNGTNLTTTFPTCECADLIMSEKSFRAICEEWHYYTPKEIEAKRTEWMIKEIEQYAKEIGQPVEEVNTIIAASNYEIEGE